MIVWPYEWKAEAALRFFHNPSDCTLHGEKESVDAARHYRRVIPPPFRVALVKLFTLCHFCGWKTQRRNGTRWQSENAEIFPSLGARETLDIDQLRGKKIRRQDTSDFLPCPFPLGWIATLGLPRRSIVHAANTTRRKRSLVSARSYGQGESKYRLHCYENEILFWITFHWYGAVARDW